MAPFVCKRTVLDHEIYMTLEYVGEDIHVIIAGGQKPHIGSVSVATPYVNPANQRRSASVSTITYPGHKDDAIGNRVATELCKMMQVPVVVCCGIHYDDLDAAQISLVVQASDALLMEMMKNL